MDFYIDNHVRLKNVPVLLLDMDPTIARRLHVNRYELLRDVVDDLEWLLNPKTSTFGKKRVQQLREWLLKNGIIDEAGVPRDLNSGGLTRSGEVCFLLKPSEYSVWNDPHEVERDERVEGGAV